MAKKQYIGISGVSRTVKKEYIGVDGVARKVKRGHIGVDGVARKFFEYWGGKIWTAIDVLGGTDNGSYVSVSKEKIYIYNNATHTADTDSERVNACFYIDLPETLTSSGTLYFEHMDSGLNYNYMDFIVIFYGESFSQISYQVISRNNSSSANPVSITIPSGTSRICLYLTNGTSGTHEITTTIYNITVNGESIMQYI